MRSTRTTSEPVEPNSTEPSRLRRVARIAILGIGFVVVTETVTRYLESLGPVTVVDDVRRHRGKQTPGAGSRIEIDDGDGTATERDTAPIDDEETSVDLTAEERSADAIDERATSDTDEPPSPGEMAIDEDVADELREDDDDGEQ